MVLLKDYEDALRYEDDPRQRVKYRREIEQLRGSTARYNQEFEGLQASMHGTSPNSITENELKVILATVQKALTEITKKREGAPKIKKMDNIERISEVINEPRMDVRHKLKITIPIIPVLLACEGELELSSGMNLETAWQGLIAKVKGHN